MDASELRALALLLKPHADEVLSIWAEEGVPAAHPQRRSPAQEVLTPEGYPEYSKYAEIVAGWDEWAEWVTRQPDRSADEAARLRNVGRILAAGVKAQDEKPPRQAAKDAFTPGGPSVDELERRIVADREAEAFLQAGLAWTPERGPSMRHFVNAFRMRLLLPPLEEPDPTDTSPPLG
ncbi:hypothetical protein DQ244_01660 [Blastococcus sp. TBT05-19]|uniref:hypothetical protein n=1 Tax=Blastococcus sp. TBT05-19 TaxID=2250581 RepID=UPI000DE8539A|nr:hypothetical protein [Blastococcus sp. TBT05-19]RBY94094.1 hypothetical protein DQ244_01660 [Blastococcus sp. TBT05-19]